MEDLLSTLAPLAAFPPMFLAIQAIAEIGSDKMGDAGLLDLEEKTPEQQKAEPPKPLTSFLPDPKSLLPTLPKTPELGPEYKDFYAPRPGEKTTFFPLARDVPAGVSEMRDSLEQRWSADDEDGGAA